VIHTAGPRTGDPHLGVAVALKTVDVWNDVEGQGMGKNLAGFGRFLGVLD